MAPLQGSVELRGNCQAFGHAVGWSPVIGCAIVKLPSGND